MKKDMNWTILDSSYTIRNVPCDEFEADGEEFIDLSVAVKLAAIRDLMLENKIPHDVSYDVFDGIEF